jgi:peptidoglycan hydrolase-like protein with peptidoglycan-binding domain
MKYNSNNKPIVCMQTQSTCYKGTRTMNVEGVLWHSTGANNPNLKRYVQPSDNASDRQEMLNILGVNTAKNDWNHIYRDAGVNAWIGKLANGEIATVQTLPWNYRPWGCGKGRYGSCNNGWIQFEICEDGLNDVNYFNKVYKEACELTAYLCKMYGLNPHGHSTEGGVKVPVILCHQDSYQYGVGGNHSDVYHWFNRYGKTMADVRNDVAALMAGSSSITPSVSKPVNPEDKGYLTLWDKGEAVRTMQKMLIACGYSCGASGADASFGQDTLKAVKAFQKSNNLEVDGFYGKASKAALEKLYKEKTSGTTTVKPSTSPSTSKPATTSKTKLEVDGSFGKLTVIASQKYFGTTQDGEISNQPTSNKKYLEAAVEGVWEFKSSGYKAGSSLIKAMQKKFGTTADGFFGKGSVTAMQKWLNAKGYNCGTADGYMGVKTVKAWQSFLNDNLK